jgi:hypothetical protein
VKNFLRDTFWFLVGFALGFWVNTAVGGEYDAKAKVAVALALQKSAPPAEFRYDCRCWETGICKCLECDCPVCRDYPAASARAIATGKPLIVWSGKAVCPACIPKLKEADHCFVPSGYFASHFPDMPADAVIVCKVQKSGTGGYLVRTKFFPAGASVEAIQEVLRPAPAVQPLLPTISPFAGRPVFTPATTAPLAVRPSIGFPATMGMGPTTMFAPGAGRLGGISGCVGRG